MKEFLWGSGCHPSLALETLFLEAHLMANNDVLIFVVGCSVFAIALTSTFISLLVSDRKDE